ncbi:midasin-like isoform X2 [Vicia villosa]|uniref:midasin-like isoform X2 n=1 Tax=Vicia villosa TaxID=3911 RepID=UPI00273BDAAE|nr:midasin-like isoform X2 [Vicia villosa]
MSIDGSFSVHSSLRRLIDRCPKLQSVPQIDSLAQKGSLVTEEEVVNELVGVFLHPSYTIPLAGCFRPIVQNFVDKAVALLRLVPNLRSNTVDDAMEIDSDIVLDDVANIVEYCVERGMGLDLHEHACFAFCRALEMGLVPLSSVLSYFHFAPAPFERFSGEQVMVEPHGLHVARLSYRFLLLKPEKFSKLWDWSCFLEPLKKPCESDLIWCRFHILKVVFKLASRAIESSNIEAQEASACLLRWEEFCGDTTLERAGWLVEPTADYMSDSPNRNMDFNQENCLNSLRCNYHPVGSPKVHEVQPPFRTKRAVTRDDISVSYTFVLTSAVKKSYERVLLAASQKWPVLLYGPSGSGKSALIAKLAEDSHNQVLSIQMDDQIDGRTLVGGYVCTDRPGEFRWQPGSLTQAVQNGFWIVFEDINKAPSDVHSILLPLLEGADSFMTERGEVIKVAESFRMFSTIAVSKFDSSESAGQGSLSVLWKRIIIQPPENEDLQHIVKVRYPDLELHASELIETFERVNNISIFQIAGFHPESSSVYCLGRFSLRDLLKWCKRITGLGFCSDRSLSKEQCNYIYTEAVDVFAAFPASFDNRLSIMKEIGKLWKTWDSAAETLYPLDKPIYQDSVAGLKIGRVLLQYKKEPSHERRIPFVEIRSSLFILERIACSVKHNEPVLLVGETGTGKTTLVQNLALRLGQKLTVLNMSQQSDVADLLGGFKPVDEQFVYSHLYQELKALFARTFSIEENSKVRSYLEKSLNNKDWVGLLRGMQLTVEGSQKHIRARPSKKRKRPLGEEIFQAWESFSLKLDSICKNNPSSGMMFSFVEGSFVTALRNGGWILLDEVNLAPPETLQRIIGVLEGENGALCLAERGDIDYIHRHPNFRIFACMNPATDAGKRDLPLSLRSRFTEYFVDEVLDDNDLSLFISQFINSGHIQLVNKIVRFYKESKKESEERLQDGANQKPQYSLRSLYRALEYTRKAERDFGFQKVLYDGFSLFFLTLLDGSSADLMRQKILSLLLGGNKPSNVPFHRYLSTFKSDGYSGNYVKTKSVEEHLGNLARAVLIKRYPVLLQGPTSSGKTSLVHYLASVTGHEFVRINNHEHTDLQEYLGSYVTDASGKLVFNEGVLVKAVRNGYWIVLDELNLAPSDVLEALNRLLDDNRELFVPELQETIKAHPDFMLFGTQNPPTHYGGRKMLSRAFRNRFIEIQVGEIPDDELSKILGERCEIPLSYASKMVEVMKELRMHRQSSRVFAGKHGFITPRDLFRWADRYKRFCKSQEDLAKDGYYLLAERLRDEDEKSIVQVVLEKHFRVKLNIQNLYGQILSGDSSSSNSIIGLGGSESLGRVLLTKSMKKLYFLVERCFQLREPVLLVGETGGGKTTVCQLLNAHLQSKLHILNCHQYTETSDFIGGFRPIRDKFRLISNYEETIEQLKKLKAFTHYPEDHAQLISSGIDQASSTIELLNIMIMKYKVGRVCSVDVSKEDLYAFEQLKLDLDALHHKWQSIFEWQDGPLIKAMKDGDLFLVDEISLADDSVLERLNSVLEPERTLSLAEKGGPDLEKVVAHSNFFVLATMNPGGDYGKKELSPALRNRFTEIWVPPVIDLDDLKGIALERISKFRDPTYQERLLLIVNAMISFWEWFNKLHPGRMLTVRDLISWVSFFDVMEGSLGPEHALLHGAFLVLLDGLSLGTGISKKDAGELREKCLSFLLQKLGVDESNLLYSKLSRMGNYGWGEFGTYLDVPDNDDKQHDDLFGIDPFYIKKGFSSCEDGGFEFKAPTTRRNASRVLRAMQLPKPVLLEGSPGVGKTSLITALGKYSGHRVVRINLSEQTDMMDLLGSDLPVESDEGMKFSWSDGILLQALKEGCWVLLDELNLAPQSVLEGLNAILDHRAEVFIPELGNTYKCPPSFRIFACQNPSHQGGGRKGLPRSFLNRFTKVYVDELVEDDYLSICKSKFPAIPEPLLSMLILLNKRMHEEIMLNQKFAKDGFPWEFNLRDVFRSCEIIEGAPKHLEALHSFLNIVYIQRMRTAADRKEVLRVFEEVFKATPSINPYPRVQLNSDNLFVGNVAIKRNITQFYTTSSNHLLIQPKICQSLEAAALCVERQWLCILVGPSCSGKTKLLRLLAALTGNVLNEVNLSSATDISELLGSFEQYDALRNFRTVVAKIESYVNEFCSLQLEVSNGATFMETDFYRRWVAFSSKFENLTSASSYLENWKNIICSLSLLDEIIEKLKLYIEKNSLLLSYSIRDLDLVKHTILKLKADDQKRLASTKFEWVTGLLIKAIERGEWIVLENANLCNPTVLDRINSLVEPNGSITVNERGIVDGNPLVIHPHQNFRMFLTVNPRYGEVSRAMRNRGVEIFMMEPYWALDDRSGSPEIIELKDVNRFLSLSGIPVAQLIDSMARAHMYAKSEGSKLNIHITYLELSHWVHLFWQLLMNGCRPIWSLQLSWEHTYLSSFYVKGEEIINFAKSKYLSVTGLSRYDPLAECPLGLPGGWPVTLRLRDYIYYSKEASIKQNCMYLEFLGSQYASHEYQNAQRRHSGDISQTTGGHVRPYLMDMRLLHDIQFPKTSIGTMSHCESEFVFNSELANKRLLFAANWTIEQATESDLKLYLLRFDWFGSQLHPFCKKFFPNFHNLIGDMIKHPIWEYILCRSKLDVDMQLRPLLSLDFVDLAAPNSEVKYLCNAIRCFDPLRLTYQQRFIEIQYNFTDAMSYFRPVLKSLHVLEDEFLMKLVASTPKLIEDTSFDDIIQLYSDLIEDHVLFWRYFSSSMSDQMIISWHSLLKDAEKFMTICPEAANHFLMESKNLKRFSSSEKSLLWIHGGHPFLPSSSDLHDKNQQLLKLSESLWPRKRANISNQGMSHHADAIVALNHDLRFLVMQDMSNSSFMVAKRSHEDDGTHIIEKLDEAYQVLLGRLEHEQNKLKMKTGSKDLSTYAESLASCCSSTSELLCQKTVFEGWQDTLPPADATSLFWDMELLKELTSVPLDELEGLQKVVGRLSNLLDAALNFSLSSSSRPPQMFSPHQKILWTLNAWTSMDAVNMKIASFILEMWFNWHESLWACFPDFVKNFSKIEGFDNTSIALPHMLIQPVCAATVLQITKSSHAIKEFWVQCLKCRVSLSNLWNCSHHGEYLPKFLMSGARALFQQIIYAHRKSFEAEQYAAIKLHFSSFERNVATEESIHLVSTLVTSSRHYRLKNSVNKFIVPLLRKLYLQSATADFNFNYIIGCAWAHIGALRIHLLLSYNEVDPAMKYYCKYTQLEETISSLELEIQVRKECGYLAGQFLTVEADKRKAERLEKLQAERRKLQRKIVFRSESWKYKKLMNECNEFLKHVAALEVLVSNVDAEDLQQVIDCTHSWQETAMSFINRLMDEYSAFNDIIQPIQVAVYEMKFGLSLVLSSTLEKEYLRKVGHENINLVMETIYALMRFPRAASRKFISVEYVGLDLHPSYKLDFGTDFYLNVGLMERLITLSSGNSSDTKVSVRCRATIYWNILVQIAYSVANAKMIDCKSYTLLQRIFDEFSSLWMKMKVDAKSKSDYDAQQFKFKSREFQIESVIEVEIPALANSIAAEAFSEWKEFSFEEKSTDKMESSEVYEISDEEWKHLEESILDNVVLIHNQLFGSDDLVQAPGIFKISDEDWLHSFSESYKLGINLIEGVHSPNLASLDAKLIPEHLFYLSIDYGKKFLSSSKSTNRYNFYKDSNAHEIEQMLKVLAPLRQQILSNLNEWEEQNDLQNFLVVIDMLLTLPSDIPLAKAFSGLQFLLHKAQVMQENHSKFSFPNQLRSVYDLMSSWQKIELGSWPALLDEVTDQYENNAKKLWFPLYSLLPSTTSDQSIVESLKDFIELSSIGEFRKRLQLLYAFLGQNHISASLKINSSPCRMPTFLYNTFGYYVQFLPNISKYIDASRKEILIELKELVKLCRWEDDKTYASIEKLKKSRQKLKKLIQKYTDILQQPFREVLIKGSVSNATDLPLFSDENRSIWFENCSMALDNAFQNLQLKKTSTFNVLFLQQKNVEEYGSILRSYRDSQHTLNLEGWKDAWHMVENLYIEAVDFSNIWKDDKSSYRKRKAFDHLLNLFRASGLTSHKVQHEDWWFIELSGKMECLLLENSRFTSPSLEIDAKLKDNDATEESSLMEWKTAIEHYFKSVMSVRLLKEICIKPHGDIDSQQVHRSISFLSQLIQIQKKQLAAASVFGEKLKHFRECASTMGKLFSFSSSTDNSTNFMCSIVPNQFATYKCLWQQKQIFDNLCAISNGELLLLRILENSHLNTCKKASPSVRMMSASIEEFLPVFYKSKESLDYYLIGGSKAVTAMASSHFSVVTQEMQQLVSENFKAIKDFNDQFVVRQEQGTYGSSVKNVLVHHFEEVIDKAKSTEEEYTTAIKANSRHVDTSKKDRFCERQCAEPNARFDEALKSTYQHIASVLQNLCAPMDEETMDEELEINIGECKLHPFVSNLKLEMLCDDLFKIITFGEKLVNCCDDKISSYSCKVGAHFQNLHMLVGLLLEFSDELLKNFFALHRSVSVTTHVIANILVSVFSKGFGTPTENEDDGTLNTSEDASGTGMGEGVGLNDVSDQITDEDQLLGTREQQKEKQDDSMEVPNNNNNGIEMDQDFQADAVSLSEESKENEDSDGENEEPESEMGPTGPDGEAVGEKIWDQNEDETPNDTREKYESGPSVEDKDESNKELRAKDDSAINESGNASCDEGDAQNDEAATQDEFENEENADEVNMDKEEAYSDATGLKPDEPDHPSDLDMDLDANEDLDPVEEGDPEGHDDSAENENQDGEKCSPDEVMEEACTEVDASSEKDDPGPEHQENGDMNSMEPEKDTSESSDVANAQVTTVGLASQSKGDLQATGSQNIASELNLSNSHQDFDNPALTGGFPSSDMSEMNLTMPDSSNTGGISKTQPKSHLPQQEHTFSQEKQTNPSRSTGDALDFRKERIKVSGDLPEDNLENHGEMDDDNADEYGYVSEFEKGTTQALGPATLEQVDRNIDGDKLDTECRAGDDANLQFEKEKSEIDSVSNSSLLPRNEKRDQVNMSAIENSQEDGSGKPVGENIDPESRREDEVSFSRSYLNENTLKISQLSVHDEEMGQYHEPCEAPDHVKDNANALWRRYELSTTKLSQELAEQLRLVLEPTVASKLQGDYKTGKRINMKKVIQYIASYYRKDKIWLRRTRPNKRDYQVVIAVDDSHSMSETCSGDVAVEALVTVCRAVSQLEMGSLAVASFGTKGNINLLHDFDMPFTGEAGVKMISNLTFKQENTIADEPVVDLLKFLTNKLDAAVVKARLPSGRNPLQQLVLIIADGRFHEKDNLKRCVRNALASNRMVAFLLLDNSQESIMDLMEASFEGGKMKFSKYMDNFPFPYYIVLRNIEALPRTLANLLRQWLELMQHSNY